METLLILLTFQPVSWIAQRLIGTIVNSNVPNIMAKSHQ